MTNNCEPWIPNPDRRIVICGSMSAYSLILQAQAYLRQQKVVTIVPEPEDDHISALSPEAFESFKRKVSFAYIKKIRDPKTYGILAVNPEKYGISDYIGPNTFAEIAVAFAQYKKIFIYYGIPKMYIDELRAWRVIELNGNIESLTQQFLTDNRLLTPQLRLFSDDANGQ